MSPPLTYNQMTIDSGWSLNSISLPIIGKLANKTAQDSGRRTYTKEEKSPIKEFLEAKNAANPKKSVYYIKNMPLTMFTRWKNSAKKIRTDYDLLGKILRPVNNLYTQWVDFEPRRPWKAGYEQWMCVLKGRELIRLASPIFRKNIYVGQLEHLEHDECPMDFFNPDYDKFPYAKQFKFVETELEAGDCLYIPAYYYVQSKTTAD